MDVINFRDYIYPKEETLLERKLIKFKQVK